MKNVITATKQARQHGRRVFFTGAVALSRGQGVCYDRVGSLAATVVDEQRDKNVALPNNVNNIAFAGVASQAYAAKTGGQWILIFEPGSICDVLVTASVTIGPNSFVTCIAGGTNAGLFSPNVGYPGRGTARVLQTVTGSVTALCELLDGDDSGLIEILTPVDNTAVQAMINGVTFLNAATLTAGNSTTTLADGKMVGDRKGFKVLGTLVTNKYLITVTSGIKKARVGVLASLALQAIGDCGFLTWNGVQWVADWDVGVEA